MIIIVTRYAGALQCAARLLYLDFSPAVVQPIQMCERTNRSATGELASSAGAMPGIA
jgi:hypothetical protein